MQLDMCKGCGDTKPWLHILAILFGMGSNLAVNGIWVELPILVFFLPEGWSLGSYMTIILQLANIAPLLYTIGNIWVPKYVRERPAIYFIAFLGSASCILLSFLWNKTSILFGSLHSTALFSLHFCLSIMDCTSSIVFITAMGVFQEPYMTTYFLGEGMSGLFPGLVALAQGVGDIYCENKTIESNVLSNGTWLNETLYAYEPAYREPRFSVMYFFIFLGTLQVISVIAYILLMYLPACKREHIHANINMEAEIPEPTEDEKIQKSSNNIPLPNNNNSHIKNNDNLKQRFAPEVDEVTFKSGFRSKQMIIKHYSDESESESEKKGRQKVTKGQYAYLLFLIGWITFLANSFLLSIQSYSCLPYGSEPYHLAVTLSTIANPAACVLALFWPLKDKRLVGILTLTGTLVGVYIVILAVLSPRPFLVDTLIGSALSVLAWVLVILILTYSRVCCALILKLHGGRGLFWYGFMTQAGSGVGAIFSLLLVNIYEIFQDASACPSF